MDYSQSNSKRNKRRQRPHAERVKNSVGVIAFRVLFAAVMVVGFGLVGGGIGLYLGILHNAPVIQTNQAGVATSFIIEERTGEELARLLGDEQRIPVPLEQMPRHLLDAFVAIEDERFFQHNGIDFRSMGRALHVNLTDPYRTEGASTITQQVIKGMLGLHRNDLISKLQEQYLALQFERALIEDLGTAEAAKYHILEIYLNMVNLGRNWHGVQIASLNYFEKDVSELTISESAVLAAITRNPHRYNPARRPDDNRYRQVLVMENMLRNELITQEQFDYYYADPVHERVRPGMIGDDGLGPINSYFVDAVILQVAGDLQERFGITSEEAFRRIYSEGLRIYATKDSRLQRIVDEVMMDDSLFPRGLFAIDVEYRLSVQNEITGNISNHTRTTTVRSADAIPAWRDSVRSELLTASDIVLSYREIRTLQPQAAFVLLDHHNGHVLAIGGGRGLKTENLAFNRATQALRSPGSQFKVLAAFAPGVDMGVMTAATHIVDEPWTFNDGHTRYTPRNWWGGRWEGPSSVRRAIYHSMNVVSARAFQDVGPENAFNYLRNFGFTTLEGEVNGRPFRDVGAAVPLGGLTLGVSQLEMAAAYGAIANLGEYHRPVLYSRVLDRDGNVILENTHNPQRVMREAAAYIVTNMMLDTVRRGTGTRAAFRNIRMPVSGKTGTSQNTVDLGFTASTPYFTGAVWLGFDRHQTMGNPGSPHLDIWRNIMERAHIELELPHRDFRRPEGVVTATVCRDTGLLPLERCATASDLFVVGTVPTQRCDGVHRHGTRSGIRVCVISGVRASPYCPPEFVIIDENFDEHIETVCATHTAENFVPAPESTGMPGGQPGGGFFNWPPGGVPGQPGQPGQPPALPPPDFPWDVPAEPPVTVPDFPWEAPPLPPPEVPGQVPPGDPPGQAPPDTGQPPALPPQVPPEAPPAQPPALPPQVPPEAPPAQPPALPPPEPPPAQPPALPPPEIPGDPGFAPDWFNMG